MQPQGHKADNVDDGSPDILESELEIERAEFGSGRSAVNGGPCSGVVAYNFGKLHFCPELDEVHHEECEHHHLSTSMFLDDHSTWGWPAVTL